MKLVTPSLALEDAFIHFYRDYKCHDAVKAQDYIDFEKGFELYVQRLIDESTGLNLREGYVPCHHFWFLNDKVQLMGVIRVRHRIDTPFLTHEGGHIGYDIAPAFRGKGFGKMMLKFALPKARALGIERALITADEDNIASRKVIEANGGLLERIAPRHFSKGTIARYWVNCF
ncbi:MAG: hypothetical protein CENE_02258 [Candidatus Celerinatantimonas neptuna]|nr:MAG: hypothetical protein CENE_02258 [Candidatus Celerinatantimonas neptuna]